MFSCFEAPSHCCFNDVTKCTHDPSSKEKKKTSVSMATCAATLEKGWIEAVTERKVNKAKISTDLKILDVKEKQSSKLWALMESTKESYYKWSSWLAWI